MPELPEVETTLRGITPHIDKRYVKKINIYQEKLRWPIDEQLHLKIKGKQLQHLQRRGKYLVLEFENGTLLIHLGMSGSLRILKSKTPLEKHDHFEIIFDNNITLRLRDPRRFGAVLWAEKNWQDHKLIKSLGPEPLTDKFDTEYLYAASRNKTSTVKSFIMDSHIVVGVGNIYASEALFRAGIHPTRAAKRISKNRFEDLVAAIKAVLEKAINEGGTTLKDFTNAEGKPGYFTQQLNVYGKANQPCPSCSTPIKHKVIAQRATYYCSHCQH